MVFCGKPSKGCGECRSRKIRCDQQRPICSQCIKANRICPGYRDQLSLLFRDESQEVIRKAKAGTTSGRNSTKAPRKSRTVSPSGNSSQSEPTVLVDNYDLFNFHFDLPPQTLLPELLPKTRYPLVLQPSPNPTKDEAACFFFRSNASPGALWMMDTSLSFVSLKDGTPSQKAMMASVTSVGMAMLSRIRNLPSLKVAAESEYASALYLMMAAVSDEAEAKEHTTLGAVLLLAIFEIVTSRAPRTIENWTSHIRGATALLELRGVEQLQTEVGLRMFLQLRYQIIISCLQRAAHVPPSLIECSKVAMFLRPQAEAYADRLINIVAKLSNLRADIAARVLTEDSEILSAASAIEAELIAWLADRPALFAYDTLELSASNAHMKNRCRGIHPYNNQYHVYSDLRVCNTWNQYRSARILVNDVMMDCLKRLSAKSSAATSSNEFLMRCRNIRNAVRQLAVDICTSVPYHFGIADAKPQQRGQLGFMPTSDSYVGGLVLLWPLCLAGIVEAPQHPLRKWVLNCLKLIGNTMGIDQALALMDMMIQADTGACPPANGKAGQLDNTRTENGGIRLITKEDFATIDWDLT